MGKRKLHAQTYFQCDWTGLPMKQTNCYMPEWNEAGRLLKHGSYCCWEAVIAHAREQLLSMETDDKGIICGGNKMKRIQEHVNALVGCDVHPAPHWTRLAWFAKDGADDLITSPSQFLEVCDKLTTPVFAVRIPPDGSAHEVLCTPADVKAKFEGHITRPFNLHGPVHEPQSFQTVRKKTNRERDLSVFYWPFKNGLPFNTLASNIFKMQIYGDVLLVQQTKEPCFLPRERYVNYYLAAFNEQFTNKSKRKEPQNTLTTDEYQNAKAQMALELGALEALASANASSPASLAKASVLPPPTGAELAALLRARGQSPPPKMQRVPVCG